MSGPHQFQQPVYPRWRGEHSSDSIVAAYIAGLSPLARGTQSGNVNARHILRFIPAGAGNTQKNYLTNSLLTVYPRWRGEHSPVATDTDALGGLSPLARGTLNRGDTFIYCARFIPAGAGNTDGLARFHSD